MTGTRLKGISQNMGEYVRLLQAGVKATGVMVVSLCLMCLMGMNSAIAYSIDYEMDQARGEKTIEYYGESLREIVEQTLRNNDGHPKSKVTAQNSYRRQSFLNDLLPEKRSSAFDKEQLMQLHQTENPKDRLR